MTFIWRHRDGKALTEAMAGSAQGVPQPLPHDWHKRIGVLLALARIEHGVMQ